MKENEQLIANLDNTLVYPISLVQKTKKVKEFHTSLYTETRGFFGGRKKPNGKYTLKVARLDAGDLELSEGHEDELVKVRYGEQEGTEITMQLTEFTTDFVLILNPEVVVGYKKPLETTPKKEMTTLVKFVLELRQEGKEKVQSSDVMSIPVRIEDFVPSLTHQIHLETSQLQWTNDSRLLVRIGYLEVIYKEEMKSLPSLSSSFSLKAESNGKIISNLLSLDLQKIVETNGVYAEKGVKVKGESTSMLRTQECGDGTYELEHIKSNDPGHKIRIPIMFHMRQIKDNPKDELHINFVLSGSYTGKIFKQKIGGHKGVDVSDKKEFVVLMNNQNNELEVECVNNVQKKRLLVNHGEFNLSSISLRKTENTYFTYHILLRNRAEVVNPKIPDACLLIKNLRQDKLEYNAKRLVMADNKTPDEFFHLVVNNKKIDGQDVFRLYPRDDKRGSVVDLALEIRSEWVQDIKKENNNFDTSLSLTFAFDYVEYRGDSSDSEEDEMQSFTGRIVWNMEQKANPKSLSVDFGTSAIVASYASNFTVEDEPLIDLHAMKTMLFNCAFSAGRQNFVPTEPAPFISSAIGLNLNNEKAYDECRKDSEFGTYPVLLSPSDLTAEISLPCLKNLIGYEYMPNVLLEKDRLKFTYKIGDETVKLYDENGRPNQRGLACVNNVLKLVYRQLFLNYICQGEKNQGKEKQNQSPVHVNEVNRLVLSVPNTFTPVHHELLKGIALDIFPNLRKKYLHVVSESDAVACYYLAKRDSFYRNVRFKDENLKKKLDKEERVLVFDMGAGTLDLTYFIREVEGDKCVNVNIQGKMGVAKAGNYLDYLLAEIICDSLEYNSKMTDDIKKQIKSCLILNKEESKRAANNSSETRVLKDFVRNVVKPCLNDEDLEVPKFSFKKHEYTLVNKNKEPMKIHDICTNKKFVAFIEECTTDVLDNMVKLYGTATKSLRMGGEEKHSLPVDVLVFSGRSTSLLKIRAGVADYIKKSNPTEVMCADLVEEKMYPLEEVVKVAEKPYTDSTLSHGAGNGDRTTKVGTTKDDSETSSSMAMSGNNKLKTVVTYGSLVYANWINRGSIFKFSGKKIFANYGVLFQHVDFVTWEWLELISASNPCENTDGGRIHFVGSEVHSIENVYKCIFVQSYSTSPAQDWSKGKKDQITKIYEIDIDPEQCRLNPRPTFRMTIDADNRVHCGTELNGELTNTPKDDFQNETLRKSLWPVVF